MEERKVWIVGKPHYKMYDKDGNLVWEYEPEHNQIQNGLEDACANAFKASGSLATFAYGDVGTGSGQGVTATELAAALLGAGSRQAVTSCVVDGTNGNQVNVIVSFGAGVGTGSIEECGLFKDNSAGGMLVYDDSISKSKGADDTLEITWKITFGTAR
jgi:hypothetical protein